MISDPSRCDEQWIKVKDSLEADALRTIPDEASRVVVMNWAIQWIKHQSCVRYFGMLRSRSFQFPLMLEVLDKHEQVSLKELAKLQFPRRHCIVYLRGYMLCNRISKPLSHEELRKLFSFTFQPSRFYMPVNQFVVDWNNAIKKTEEEKKGQFIRIACDIGNVARLAPLYLEKFVKREEFGRWLNADGVRIMLSSDSKMYTMIKELCSFRVDECLGKQMLQQRVARCNTMDSKEWFQCLLIYWMFK